MNGLRASCFFAFFALLTPLSAEPVAMRAPLSIIPEAARAQFGMAPQNPVAGDVKLAPRAAARQMNRAVRAVASVPGSQSDIVQIGQLGALQDAPVGLEPGLGPDVWSGARLTYVVGQIGRLPEKFQLQTLRALELRLHRGQAAAPAGTIEGMSWFGARLNRFLSLGDTTSVLALAQLTGAADIDAYVAAAVVDAYLARRDDEKACAHPLPNKKMRGFRTTKPYFLRLQIFCQMRAGQVEKVALAVELNEKSLDAHKWFADLAYRLSVGTTLADLPPPPARVDYLDLALARFGSVAIPRGVSVLPRAIVPAMAADTRQPAQLQLAAALQSISDGLLPAAKFSEIALQADGQTLAPAALPAPNGVQADYVDLAFFVRFLDMAPPGEKPRLLHMALRQAEAAGYWAAAVQILANHLQTVAFAGHAMTPDLVALEVDQLRAVTLGLIYLKDFIAAENLLAHHPPQPELAAFAAFAGNIDEAVIAAIPLRAALAPPALTQTPQADTTPSTLTPRADLTAALPTASPALPRIANMGGFDWAGFQQRYAAATPAARAYLAQQVGVWQVFDPDTRRASLPPAFAAELGLDGATPRQQRYAKLANNGWIGDLVLALVADFAEMPPAQLSGADLAYMLNALVIAEQENAARDLAREVLTGHFAALSAQDIAYLDPDMKFDPVEIDPIEFDPAGFDPAEFDPAAASPSASTRVTPDVSEAAPPQPGAPDGIYFPPQQPNGGMTERPDG